MHHLRLVHALGAKGVRYYDHQTEDQNEARREDTSRILGC